MQPQDLYKEETVYLYFREVFVGKAENVEQDMWYMEGKWQPEATKTTAELETDLKSRSIKEALHTLKGKLIKWSCDRSTEPQNYGLAICIYDNKIVVRLITSDSLAIIEKDSSYL